MTTIYITSPAGSGNIYMREFLIENVYADVILHSHLEKDILDYQNHIFILRNPKDCIASGVFRHSKEKRSFMIKKDESFDDFDTNKIKELIYTYTQNYINFLKSSKLKPNLYTIPFDYFFNNQVESLNKIAIKFNLKLHNDIKISSNKNFIIRKMMQTEHRIRIPSKKTENRLFVDSLVEEEPLYKEAHTLYLDILQSTESML
jgi:hypothetical protein